jgi:RND family efflux transporter MFP subunit
MSRATRNPCICLISALAYSTIISSGCSRSDTAHAKGRDPETTQVKVEVVTQAPIHRAVEVVGTLAAEDAVTLSAEAEGRVSRIDADLGDHVKAGQVLIELDREKSQYNVDQQRAALDRALASYGASSVAQLPPAEKTPDVQKAQAELGQAQLAYTRAKELFGRQLVPQQTLDDAQVALTSKQAGYESALQNAKNLRATINASDAAVKLADRELRDTSIRSPFDGLVAKRLVSLGEFVKIQAPVMSVVRIDPLKVMAEIPEKLAPWIQAGQSVDVRVDAFPGKVISGKVTRISPLVNTSTRAFPFEARIPNEDSALKPGTFARVHIESGQVDQVMTVPYSAIQYRYGVNRVFVVNDNRLKLHELKVGDRQGDRIEVVSGVQPGDRVVSGNVDNLTDGTAVTVSTASE